MSNKISEVVKNHPFSVIIFGVIAPIISIVAGIIAISDNWALVQQSFKDIWLAVWNYPYYLATGFLGLLIGCFIGYFIGLGRRSKTVQEKPHSHHPPINIVSPEKNSTIVIGGRVTLTGTFEETLPKNRVKLFKHPQGGNYWPLVDDLKIDFNCGNYGERKWCAEIDVAVEDGKPGDKVEYVIAILEETGLADWIKYENLKHTERYGMPTLPSDTRDYDRLTLILTQDQEDSVPSKHRNLSDLRQESRWRKLR